MGARSRLWSRNYALVCAATLTFYIATMMQVPLFPDFLRQRAHASGALIGTFIGMISFTAILLRPWVGRELATRPRRWFIALGGVVTAVTAAVYLWAGSLAILIPVRLFQGLALASFYTSSSTLVADLAPDERRGEALSYFSMFLYLGLAGGPALGLALESVAGFHAVFGVSTGLAVGCAAIAGLLREPPICAPEAIEIERRPLLNRAVLFPAGVLMLAAFGYGAGINFTADFARQAGIGGRGVYFPVLAGTVIAIRFLAGRASDRLGRIRVAVPGLALFAAAMAMESAARSTGPLLVSAVLFGAGFGMFYPSMMALAVDLVRPHERGSAMATFTSAFDIGFGVGSPMLGAISGASGYPTMYAVAAVFAVASLAALLVGTARRGGTLGLLGRGQPTPQPR